MKKLFAITTAFLLIISALQAGNSTFSSKKGSDSGNADSLSSSLLQTRSFNQYIWNKVPGMFYHRVLAQVSIPENPNGTVVIICPGGSYHHLDILNEGLPTQKWFNRNGASAIILRYRTAGRNYHYPAMMQDIQRMIQLVRENPEKYGSSDDRLKLGLIGYSAGGHLVTWAGAFGNRTNELKKIGIKETPNLTPDFVIPVYPVVTMEEDIGHKWSRKSLIGKHPDYSTRLAFSMEQQIPPDMPPTYLVACRDDPVVIYQNSIRLAEGLKNAGTDFCFTDYPWGGHGFGMKRCKFLESFHWNDKLLVWLKEHNFL